MRNLIQTGITTQKAPEGGLLCGDDILGVLYNMRGVACMQSMNLGGWDMNVSTEIEYFPQKAIDEADSFLKRWSRVFPKGETWVGRTYGVPSLIVRFDCVVDHAGKLRIYELEERPCGIGATRQMVPAFKDALSGVQKTWPEFYWVGAPNRHTDDALWLGNSVQLEDAFSMDALFLVRSRPSDVMFHVLEDRAVSSVRHEGDKSYGATLGLWSSATFVRDDLQRKAYIDYLPMESCVVKPLQGTRSNGIDFYMVGNDQNEFQGRYRAFTLERLVSRIRKEGAVYCQPFIRPMRRKHVPNMGMIYRFYFGFDCRVKEYVPLGGVWMANRDLLIHGRNDTVSGPLLLA